MTVKYLTVSEAIQIVKIAPKNERERLMKAYAQAILDTWSASCGTDGSINLRPYYKAEKAARDAFNACVESV